MAACGLLAVSNGQADSQAHSAGQLRPCLDKMNGHSTSVPFGHTSIWCRSARGSVQLQRKAWERGAGQTGANSLTVVLTPRWAPWLCRRREGPTPGHSFPSSLSSVAHFYLKFPPPNSPSRKLSLRSLLSTLPGRMHSMLQGPGPPYFLQIRYGREGTF